MYTDVIFFCYEGRQLTTFNKQARVLVGAVRDKFGKLTRPFYGVIAGLSVYISVNSLGPRVGRLAIWQSGNALVLITEVAIHV